MYHEAFSAHYTDPGLQDRPLEEWAVRVDEWLLEMLSIEGRMGFTSALCSSCRDDAADYRCCDCIDLRLYCRSCISYSHISCPFHRIQVRVHTSDFEILLLIRFGSKQQKWTGTHFERWSLKQLGVRIQLGHAPGEHCPNPKPAFDDDFIVLDTTGIHHVCIQFCDCTAKTYLPNQLMRARLFPATVSNPKTAATYRLLEQFHILRTQSKISAYEYYQSLARLTDNVSVENPPVRLQRVLYLSSYTEALAGSVLCLPTYVA